MIAIPSNVRVWLATGHTDMRRGFPSLALLVQESLKRDPHAGDLYVFRGRRGDLLKIIWHDGQGACLWTLPVAFDGWRRRHDQRSPIVLSSVRNRLAHAPGNLASKGGWMICD
jgi:transposase